MKPSIPHIFITVLITLALVPATSSAHTAPSSVPTPEHPYPTYGNETIGDCTFAAAADWTIIVDGITPPEDEVRLDFYEVGGQRETGVQSSTMFDFWMKHGISGHRQLFSEVNPNRQVLEEAVYHHVAILAEVHFQKGEVVGFSEVSGTSYHMLVVDGYSPSGPNVVTWGFTTSVTWEQWEHDAVKLYIPKATTPPIERSSRHPKHHRHRGRHTRRKPNHHKIGAHHG